jgi:hypothetical protein
VVSSGRKPRVVMCRGDDFVSMARAPSLATDTKNDLWFEVAHRRVCRHIVVVTIRSTGAKQATHDKFGGRPHL